jgi:hypothetical protein
MRPAARSTRWRSLGAPIKRKRTATACEHDGDADFYQGFEGRSLIGDLIEGAMKTHRHRPGSSNQRRHDFAIDPAVIGQSAKNDAEAPAVLASLISPSITATSWASYTKLPVRGRMKT